MGSVGVPLLLLVGVLPGIPGSEVGQETRAHFLYQEKSDCHFFNGTQRLRFLDRYFYDRQEIVHFDSDVGKFVAVTPLGQLSADYWNSRQDYLQDWRAAVDRFCRHNYEMAKTRQVVGRRAHRHHLPHQDGPRFPQHHPPLHRDRLLPPGDRRPVAEERAAGEGGRRLRGGAPERGLDLPAPGAAGDPAPAWGRLRLQGGARQPGGPRHRPVGATFLQRCQEQALDGGRGGRAGGGLPGCGALPLPEEQESNSHPTTSPHELILLSLPALRCKIAEAFQHLMNFCLFCNPPRMQLQHWREEENRGWTLSRRDPRASFRGLSVI